MIPESFFDWAQLTTYAGAVLAVTVVVQFTKDLPCVRSIPTRVWAYAVAAVLHILSTLFTADEITAAVVLMCLLNAVLVAMAAVGGYDITHKIKTE